MRPLRTKSEPKELLDTASDSLAAMRGRAQRDTLLKASLIAGGLAALTAWAAVALAAFKLARKART